VDRDGRMALGIFLEYGAPYLSRLPRPERVGTAVIGLLVAGAGYQAAQDINVSGLIYSESTASGKENSTGEGTPGSYAPDRPLPRDERSGNPVPDSEYPHTQLGKKTSSKTGEEYTQAREFGQGGQRIKDIHFTDHGRKDHPNPHQRRYDSETGKRGPKEPLTQD